jgi:hypothetical protein
MGERGEGRREKGKQRRIAARGWRATAATPFAAGYKLTACGLWNGRDRFDQAFADGRLHAPLPYTPL